MTALVSIVALTVGVSAPIAGATPAVVAAPVITAVYPTSGTPSGNTPVTIVGTHLWSSSTVQFDGQDVAVQQHGNHTVQVLSPAHDPGVAAITVQTDSGTSAPADYTYFSPSADRSFTWSSELAIPRDVSGRLGVSCVSSMFCMALDASGNAFRYDGTAWGRNTPTGLDRDVTKSHDISCASSKFCLAVDEQGTAVVYNGSWGAPTAIDIDGGDPIRVSCTSRSFCLAVSNAGHSYRYNGARWKQLPDVTDTVDSGALTDLSCVTPTMCMVGTRRQKSTTGSVFMFDGRNWHRSTSDHATRHPAAIETVSCANTTFCAATDSHDYALTFNGHHWSKGSRVEKLRVEGGDGDDPREVINPILTVSCTQRSFCITVDAVGGAARFTGTKWVHVGKIDPAPVGYVYSASCAGDQFCLVGDWGDVLKYHGKTWGRWRAIDPPVGHDSFSCPADNYCVLVGDEGAAATVYNGTSFTEPTPVIRSADRLDHSSIDCATPKFCALVSGSRAATLDGTEWSKPVTIDSHRLQSVSCSSSHYCVAVDIRGYAITYNGNRWGTPQAIDLGRRLKVSCAAGQVCAAIDSGGHALVLKNGTWSKPRTLEPFGTGLSAVSCGGPTLCMVVAQDGNAIEYDGSKWLPAVGVASSNGSYVPATTLRTVSCPAATFCVAAQGSVVAPEWTYTFDGSSWSLPADTPDAAEDDFMSHLSCASTDYCMASFLDHEPRVAS
ncbi:MAG TPA: IPT/TIG domain-containing protein [Jatrophihabitantaceae bacterium]